VPGLVSRGVFLSYRREDAAPYARLLQRDLGERLPDTRVFMDLDSIEPGLDFAEVIREAVGSCAVLVALIGRQWATLTDEEGHRRLDNPDDFVRLEVQEALERAVRVVPVLVDGARPLRQQQLPSGLQKLARLNALELSYGRYEYDAERLLDTIQRVLAVAPGRGETSRAAVRPEGDALGEAAKRDLKAVRYDRARATRVLARAEHIAQSITDENGKGEALAHLAKRLAATDPSHAARLFADAERIAQQIPSEPGKQFSDSSKEWLLATVAGEVAVIDPDRAERIAESITGEGPKNRALEYLALGLAATDPERAERVAESINDDYSKCRVFAHLAAVVAATDWAHAERMTHLIIESITDEEVQVLALGRVAAALAATDPDRAARLAADIEHIAESATDEDVKLSAQLSLAKTLGATDPYRYARLMGHVEGFVEATAGESRQGATFIVRELAVDLDVRAPVELVADAERIARFIDDEDWKGWALIAVAEGFAVTDPDRAVRIARSITVENQKAWALAMVAATLAATDPDRAEGIAESITREAPKVIALADLAGALAAPDSDRAVSCPHTMAAFRTW
jgi:TIR domain